MNDFPTWKVWMLTALLIVGVLLAIPSLLTEAQREQIPDFLPQPSINLGLDLSGGVHILLEAQTEEFEDQRLQTMSDRIEDSMEDDGPLIEIGSLSRTGGQVSFTVRDEAQLDDAMERVRALTQPVGFTGERDFSVENEDSLQIVVRPTETGTTEAVNTAVETATEVVRARIDELGTREPTIIRQGSERIVVQVPGLDSPESLMSLLGRTASLEFRMVNYDADPNMALACQAPIGSEALPYANQTETAGCAIVQRRVMVSGDQLVNAQQGFDQRTGEVTVNLTFDGPGGRAFGRVTQENVGRPFAIILDGEVLSAPNINEPILGGNAQITGSFSVQSANELAIALALWPLAGRAGRDRRSYGRRGNRRRRRAARRFGRHDRYRCSDDLHVHHLWPVWHLFEHCPGAEPVSHPGNHGDAGCDPNTSGDCRLCPDSGCRGRRERADQ